MSVKKGERKEVDSATSLCSYRHIIDNFENKYYPGIYCQVTE